MHENKHLLSHSNVCNFQIYSSHETPTQRLNWNVKFIFLTLHTGQKLFWVSMVQCVQQGKRRPDCNWVPATKTHFICHQMTIPVLKLTLHISRRSLQVFGKGSATTVCSSSRRRPKARAASSPAASHRAPAGPMLAVPCPSGCYLGGDTK